MLRPQLLQAIPNVEEFLRYCEIRDYPKRSTILREGAVSDKLYLILDGSVSVTVEDEAEEGHKLVVSYLNLGDFFGEMALFAKGEEVRSAEVVTREASRIAEITYDRFRKIMHQFPDIIFGIAEQMAIRLRRTTFKLKSLAFVDVSGRIASTLMDLAQQPDAMTHPEGMQIKVTRQELGKIAGCSREMAGRVLKSLEEEGLVSVAGKTIVVLEARAEG
ncbi:MAG: cAMP-activated global transcriptional regulator CRP [Halieaceae bacterium]|jgi:CRP/FNR family cyclic AMP-dependent transcriptional regulator|nr:cAMP-activated global transcriptional regulator CRP [Halieaceae bacterium]